MRVVSGNNFSIDGCFDTRIFVENIALTYPKIIIDGGNIFIFINYFNL